jgi:hypothetical protein
VKQIQHAAVGEIIPAHVEIRVEGVSVAFIYEPIACHSYNVVEIDKKEVFVATIDTILNFYFAFYYVNKPYYDKSRLICLAKHLFELEEKNRLEQSGLLRRFSLKCIGYEKTVEDMRAERSKEYKLLHFNRKSKEFERQFLKYNPATSPALKKNKSRKKLRLKMKMNKTVFRPQKTFEYAFSP